MQDEFGNTNINKNNKNKNDNNNFDPNVSTKQNLDFHLDATWELSSLHDISYGLFRVNARNKRENLFLVLFLVLLLYTYTKHRHFHIIFVLLQ